MTGSDTKPETDFKVGAVRATVWTNRRLTREGEAFESHKVILERTYRQGQEFKTTSSLEIGDIPKAIMALWKAYDFLLCAEPSARVPGGDRASVSPGKRGGAE